MADGIGGQRSNQLNYVPAEDYGVAHGWWALSDLNGRPFGCKPNALTAELSAPTSHILHSIISLQQISNRNFDRNSWNIWNNFDRFGLRQLKSMANSLHNLRSKRLVLAHCERNVPWRYGWRILPTEEYSGPSFAMATRRASSSKLDCEKTTLPDESISTKCGMPRLGKTRAISPSS